MPPLKYGLFAKGKYGFSPFRRGAGIYTIDRQGKAPGSRMQQLKLVKAAKSAAEQDLYRKMHPLDVAKTHIGPKIVGQTDYTKIHGYARERRRKTKEQIIAKCDTTIARLEAEIGRYFAPPPKPAALPQGVFK